MKKEIEPFMDPHKSYLRLVNALYPCAKCIETAMIIEKYCDEESQQVTIPPKKIARELMKADIQQLMADDIFYFIEKALRDAYYQIDEPYASYELGCLYYYERFNHINYDKAFKYFNKEDSIGDSNTMLGVCYFYGQGCEKNYELAYHNLVKSALSGKSAQALYLLGDMYLNGYYVNCDRLEASELYEKALQVSQELDSSYFVTAEIFYRRGNDYASRNNKIDQLRDALIAYNLAETLYIGAILEASPSVREQLHKCQSKQNEVKEMIDHILCESDQLMNE